jgi:predicted YcjX-like family ATPase
MQAGGTMTDLNTSPESSSGKTAANAITDLLSESKSGSQETILSGQNLTPSHLQGVRRVLRFLERDRQEVAEANRNANFDRQKGITSGMTAAYHIAYSAIVAEYPQVLSGD